MAHANLVPGLREGKDQILIVTFGSTRFEKALRLLAVSAAKSGRQSCDTRILAKTVLTKRRRRVFPKIGEPIAHPAGMNRGW